MVEAGTLAMSPVKKPGLSSVSGDCFARAPVVRNRNRPSFLHGLFRYAPSSIATNSVARPASTL